MTKFSVYSLKKSPKTYVVDVQANVWGHFRTRVIVPLVPEEKLTTEKINRLQPIIKMDGKEYLFLAPEITVLPVKEIGKMVGDVTLFYDDIRDALDFLFQGF